MINVTRRLLLLQHLVLLLAPTTLASCTHEPAVHTEDPNFNFGHVIQGDRVRHSFNFLNSSKANLSIEKIDTTCGCVAVMFDTHVEPGKRGKVELELDTARLQGTVEKTATVLFKNKSIENVKFSLSGHVLPFAEIEPKLIQVSGLPGRTFDCEVTILPAPQLGVTVLNAETKDDSIKLSFPDVKAELPIRLLVKGRLGDEPGTKLETISLRFKTADEQIRHLPIPARIEVLDTIEVHPNRAVVFRKPVGTPGTTLKKHIEKRISVRARTEDTLFDIHSVELLGLPSKLVESDIAKIREGRDYEIRLTLQKVPCKRLVRGSLLLHTDEAKRKPREIKILIVSEETAKQVSDPEVGREESR